MGPLFWHMLCPVPIRTAQNVLVACRVKQNTGTDEELAITLLSFLLWHKLHVFSSFQFFFKLRINQVFIYVFGGFKKALNLCPAPFV